MFGRGVSWKYPAKILISICSMWVRRARGESSRLASFSPLNDEFLIISSKFPPVPDCNIFRVIISHPLRSYEFRIFTFGRSDCWNYPTCQITRFTILYTAEFPSKQIREFLIDCILYILCLF